MMGNSVLVSLLVMMCAAWRRRYLIVTPIVLLPVLGFLVGQVTPKKYQTHMSFLIQETAKMNPFLEDFAVSTNLKERMAALETLLHSRHVLQRVALETEMITQDTPDSERDAIVNTLSGALRVTLVGSDLIKITYETPNPTNMANTLEKVSASFIENLLAPEQSSIAASEEFLTAQLTTHRANLAAAEKRLADYKAQHADELPELHMGNVERLRDTRQLITERKMELAGAQAALASLTEKLVETNPVIGKLEERIVTLRGELAVLRARYTDNHSRVQTVTRQLQSVEEERARILEDTKKLTEDDMKRLWNMASSVNNAEFDPRVQPLLVNQLQELQAARTKVDRLAEEIATLTEVEQGLDARVAAFGQNEQTLRELERDLNVNRKLYDDLLNRFEMAKVTGALGRFEAPERIKVIDRPFQPSGPSNLPTFLFVLAGLVGGIVLGTGLAVVAEAMDSRIWRKDALRELSGVPVLTRIPPLKPCIEGMTATAPVGSS